MAKTDSVIRHLSEGETDVERSLLVLKEANRKMDSTNFT